MSLLVTAVDYWMGVGKNLAKGSISLGILSLLFVYQEFTFND